ncbi:MAG: EamA family transporter [Planctomycetota bacterium]|jgi:drug/metabolite transporter (DMT)-like permease
MITGISLGLLSATFLSLSYLFSRVFVKKSGSGSTALLAISHIYMAVFSLILLPFFFPDNIIDFSIYGYSLIGASFFYFAGQFGLFMSLKYVEASRVSPLLGLKILILTVISVTVMGKNYSVNQYLAVLISFSAAVLLNYSGIKLTLKAFLWVIFTCIGYSLSDINITSLVGHFKYLGFTNSVIVSVCLCYIICGAGGIILLALKPVKEFNTFKMAIPFSLLWFVAMLCLFATFGALGVVFGNIIQATRGIISIIIGVIVAGKGYHFLEMSVGKKVFIARLIAGLLMFSAIVLFSLG